jgi:hypothetical protein
MRGIDTEPIMAKIRMLPHSILLQPVYIRIILDQHMAFICLVSWIDEAVFYMRQVVCCLEIDLVES